MSEWKRSHKKVEKKERGRKRRRKRDSLVPKPNFRLQNGDEVRRERERGERQTDREREVENNFTGMLRSCKKQYIRE